MERSSSASRYSRPKITDCHYQIPPIPTQSPLTSRVDRKKVIAQSQAAAIKKRTDNIAARADARKKGKSHQKESTKPKTKDSKGRPGFEGKSKGGKGGKTAKGGMDKKARAASKA